MSRVRRQTAILLALVSATLLTGCNKTPGQLNLGNDLTTASTTPVSLQALAEQGEAWRKSPSDLNKGLAYANGLEAVGQTQEQLDVYRRLLELHPSDVRLAGLYGRKLVAAGRASEAVPVLQAVEDKGDADWRIASALGSAYDQQGLYQKAREQYAKALASDPQNMTVINNLGMSYALEGNLKQAEAELRKADAMPRSKSEPKIRQNLALVVGLQGRFDEATALAKEDLPPEQVEENMAYLQKMLSQPNTWQQISQNNQG
ncbi:tetratricopeptide repeat protein [Aestuariivirga sp.]|jgi:Flp pilus assembly protein TadD|uniref:tetratricopeptide repeat protein n=1 Tax=Aestuariivirga sp. TaxID=2650926 RepID=UPI003782FD2B